MTKTNMMEVTERPYLSHQDQANLIDILLAYRMATGVQIYPTIWRTRLLLSSRVWDSAHDSRVWEDTSGQMLGFSMLWRRKREDTYLVLDRFVQPDLATDKLVEIMLAWGVQRVKLIAEEKKTAITLYAAQIAPTILPHDHFVSHGFSPVAPNPEQHNVYFARSLATAVPSSHLPNEYEIRPLQSNEIQAFQTIYDFATVNPEHLQETLASDEYEHLVVINPEGALVAYCEFSICRAEWRRSGQKIGWIDYVGTIPEQQQKGLGKAVLLASLQRLQNWGAETVQLVTVNTNTPAIILYHATGFSPLHVLEPTRYKKRIRIVTAANAP
jgi:ribosomal protein S18 acetylase RimI-like enzyme